MRRTPGAGHGLSDESLLTAFGLGEPRAAATFIDRFQGRVYGLALTMLGDPALAEDVAQEALLRAWRHAEAYDARRGSVVTWLLAITRNLAIDAVRLHRPSPTDPETVVALVGAASDAGPAERAIRADERSGLVDALSRLPVAQRRAIVLAVFGGRSAQEVASREGIPLGTAKTRIRDGLIRLRGLVDSEAMRA